MDTEHAVVLFTSLGLLAVAAVLVLFSPAIVGDGAEGIQQTRLVDFEATEPYCGDLNATAGSSVSEDVTGGERLHVNDTVPVAGPDAVLREHFESWGPGRHTLALTSVVENETETPTATPAGDAPPGGQGSPTVTPTEECTYVVRYNATVEFARESDWTLLTTYEGELVSAYWRDDVASGSFESFPATPAADNATEATPPTATVREDPGGGR